MKKLFILLIFVMLFVVSGCDYVALPDPKTNLEFWIAEDVNDVDFSDYICFPGFGANAYVNSKYPVEYSDGNYPECTGNYVKYTVGNYPDESSNSLHITNIDINDPEIHFYGLSINSTKEEILKVFEEELKFDIEISGSSVYCSKGKYHFSFDGDSIYIRVDITNHFGIIY